MARLTACLVLLLLFPLDSADAADRWEIACVTDDHLPRTGRVVSISPRNEWLDEYDLNVRWIRHPLEDEPIILHGKNHPILEVDTTDKLPYYDRCRSAIGKEPKRSSFLRNAISAHRHFLARAVFHDIEHEAVIIPVRVVETRRVHLLFVINGISGDHGGAHIHLGVAHGDPD